MKLNILIGCETSGETREAFRRRGHNAWSCDLLPADDESPYHLVMDVRQALRIKNLDLAILHPPCTRLCASGVRWLDEPPPGKTFEQMFRELNEGADLFSACLNADIPHLAVENPVMHRWAKEEIQNYREPSQYVHPWMFGTDENGPDNVTKRTGLWLKDVPRLEPLGILDGTTARDEIATASPGKDRWKIRSKTFPGMAEAFAEQWSGPLLRRKKHRCLRKNR